MAEIVPRIYSNFRGVDFRGEEINLVRSPDSLNVWKDYRETESIRTRPGMKLVNGFDFEECNGVHGIYFYKGKMIVHVGDLLLEIGDETTVLFLGYTGSGSRPSAFEVSALMYSGVVPQQPPATRTPALI